MGDRSWRKGDDEPVAPDMVFKHPTKRPRHSNVGSGTSSGTEASITPRSENTVPVRPNGDGPSSGQAGASETSGSSRETKG